MPFSIIAEKREGKTADDIRTAGSIPGILYGSEITPVSVAVAYTPFEKLYRDAGESSLIDFSFSSNGAPVKVLIQDIQLNPVNRRIIHVDFRQINMSEEMTTSVALELIGESLAVKQLGGTLVHGTDSVEVKCLPKDLVGQIDVDLSLLKTFDDVIYVKNLAIPAGITVLDNPDTLVAKVTAPLTEDQLKAMDEAGPQSIADVEVEKKGKEDVAEGESTGGEGKKEDK